MLDWPHFYVRTDLVLHFPLRKYLDYQAVVRNIFCHWRRVIALVVHVVCKDRLKCNQWIWEGCQFNAASNCSWVIKLTLTAHSACRILFRLLLGVFDTTDSPICIDFPHV